MLNPQPSTPPTKHPIAIKTTARAEFPDTDLGSSGSENATQRNATRARAEFQNHAGASLFGGPAAAGDENKPDWGGGLWMGCFASE